MPSKHTPYILSNIQQEILNGSLLGDATICKKGGVIYASKSKQHVGYFANYFLDVSAPRNKNSLSYISQFDSRTNKIYHRYSFTTQINECFKLLRNKWYKPLKTIPDHLILTPLTCLFWYLGDGGIAGTHLEIATHSFHKKSLETIILPQLSIFEATLYQQEKPEQFSIYIPRRKIEKFLDYIGNCPFEDYKHKWRIFPYKYQGVKLKFNS